MKCPYLKNEVCLIIHKHTNVAFKPHIKACEDCIKQSKPMQWNKVTIGLSIAALRSSGDTKWQEKAKVWLNPNQASNIKKVWTYAKALARWAKAGYPIRTQEQAQAIFDTYCKKCEYFNGKMCRHLNCGCRISGQYKTPPTLLGQVRKALSDKLTMGTEKCPENKW